MVRRTSAMAFRRIQEEGILKGVKLKVYEDLYYNGPSTSYEISERTGLERVCVSPVLAPLRERDALYEAEERECTVSGHVAIAWDVTVKIPGPPPKKPKSKAKQCDEMEALLLDVAKWLVGKNEIKASKRIMDRIDEIKGA